MLRARQAFTLLELIIVISLIAVLAGLLISSLGLVGKQSKSKKCQTVVDSLMSGLTAYQLERGGSGFKPAPHPGLRFSANQQETCADKRLPMFYGWRVVYATVLGAPQSNTIAGLPATLCSRLGLADLDRNGVIDASDGDAPSENKRLIETVYGTSGTLDRLRNLGAVVDTTSAGNILGNALYSLDGTASSAGDPSWGRQPPTTKEALSDNWKHYRLPGTALVDPWGCEILLVQHTTSKQYGFVSAGPDSVFAIDPGDDGGIDTAVDPTQPPPNVLPLAGNDRDGRRDNIVSGFIEP